jgi:hypothetical protein
LTIFVLFCQFISSPVAYILCIADIDEQIRFATDKWTYRPDNAISAAEIPSDLTLNCQASELCDFYLNINLEIPLFSLHDPQDGYVLYQILKRKIKETNAPLLKARRYIRICAVPGV